MLHIRSGEGPLIVGGKTDTASSTLKQEAGAGAACFVHVGPARLMFRVDRTTAPLA
jgi:hypothetical protein